MRTPSRFGQNADARSLLFDVSSLSIGPAHNGHEFLDLPTLVGLVAGSNCVLHAMGDVVTKDFFLAIRNES